MFRAPGFLLIALSLCSLSLAAAETPVTPFVIGPAPGNQSYPAIATDGHDFLAVWSDYREGLGPVIYGARLGSRGELLDPTGLRLGSSGAASVAYGDGRYLVVTSFLDTFSVGADGSVRQGPSLGKQSNLPQLAFGGRDFLVCWSFGSSLHGLFVSRDGVASGAQFSFGVSTVEELTLQSIAFNGSRFIVLYTRAFQLRAAVLDASGASVSDQALDQQQSPFSWGNASVASNGGTFVAAWQVGGHEIRAVQFDDRGVQKGGVSTVRFPAANESLAYIRLVPRDSGYVLLDSEGPLSLSEGTHRVMALPITTPGGLFAFGPSRIVLSDPLLWASGPAAASNATTTVTLSELWNPNEPSVQSELYAVQVDPLGQPTTGSKRQTALPVTRAAAAQHDPALAANDDGMLVAWQEDRGEPNGVPEIAATFFDRSGSQAITNLVAPSDAPQELPSAAGLGTSFFVAWRESFGAVRGRLLERGLPVGPVLTIADTASHPSAPIVRSDGSQFVVAWISGANLYTTRFAVSGAPADSSAPIAINRISLPVRPALACAHGECLVAWRDDILTYSCPRLACSTLDSKLLAVRLGARGERHDSQPLLVAALGNDSPISLSAAGDERFGYAVAWDQLGRERRISVSAVDLSGASRPLATGIAGEAPSLVWDGTSWVVAHSLQLSSGEHDTLAERIPASGGTPGTFLISATSQDEHAPVALAADGTVVFAYERTTRNEPAAGVNRVYLGKDNGTPRRRIAR